MRHHGSRILILIWLIILCIVAAVLEKPVEQETSRIEFMAKTGRNWTPVIVICFDSGACRIMYGHEHS